MRVFIGTLVLLAAIPASAIVDMKNANYTNTWTDITVPGTGYDMRVARTYNSRSLFSGIFGFGWCSDFETTLEVLAEGNLRLTECGAGQEIIYTPRDFDKKDLDKFVATLMAKIKASAKTKQPDGYYKELMQDISEDEEIRAKYAREQGMQLPVKEGQVFLANGREVENIVFNKKFYTRTLPDGSQARFSPDKGKMTAMYDKNGNFLKLEWDKNNLKEVVDNNGRKLSFKYFQNGKVQKVTGPNGLSSEYKFANLDDLSWVKNGWGNEYKFAYDDLHNLVKIDYPDNTFFALTYDKQKDWVMSFTDRQKCLENYTYDTDKNDPKNHHWSTVKKTCGKDVIADNKFEFWYKNRSSDGRPFLQRVATTVNDNTTDVTYHEIFGRPLVIIRNNEKVNFTYYANGLVQSKAQTGARFEYEYEQKQKKVSKVSSTYTDPKGKVIAKKVSAFKYDDKGNLTYAQNSDGQKVNLTYDNRGRIATITDQAKKVVKIEYEEKFGKPAIVSRPGLGTIRVSYKNSGEINKVESKEGPQVATQVASTFNNLLDIIAPATAEIYL
ncbi:MAG: DUF6531 domain-containing protein [Pseudobdellovibrionaceae bacterium]